MLSQCWGDPKLEGHYKETVIYRINSLIKSMNAESCGDSDGWVKELGHIRDITEYRWQTDEMDK